LYKEKQDSVTNANAFLVIATFVASAAFTSWLQPPRGYTSNESDVAVKEHPILQAFVLFNGCSFFFAIATILASTYVTMLSLQQAFIGDVVESMKKTRIIASILLSICIFCVLGSFATAGFAVLPPSIEYNWSMWATVIIIIGIVCVMLRVAFIRKL
jgi:phosphoglycerol transferase MdoB-like AlkP superfamily enzyme